MKFKRNTPNDTRLLAGFMCMHEPVTESGCWLWTGTRDKNGYGAIWNRGENSMRCAHRVSYQLFVGQIPPGMHVLHKCDTPSCVNPKHLFVGTHSTNMKDMYKKGRKNNSGERNPRSVLTDIAVKEIKSSTETIVSLSKKYSVSCSTVSMIRSGKKWSHIS